MAKDEGSSAAETAAKSDKVTETLSQFVARVLNQLALSAWLPSAALVLLLVFVFELGSVLDAPSKVSSTDAPAIRALRAIEGISIGGALLLISAVIVLTMVTQAFSFEAIRVLEGYWGTNRAIELLAQWRCSRHRRSLDKLRKREKLLTELAWEGVQRELQKVNDELADRNQAITVTPDIVAVMRSRILKTKTATILTPSENEVLSATLRRWQTWAPPEILRRRINVEKRLRDYPTSNRILPTKLGNVLRRYEDRTHFSDVETAVQRIFDELPFSMRVEHDEQRTRLDLYCSMVVVVATVTVVAVIRFAFHHLSYSVYSLVVSIPVLALMYRAGVASARAYGSLLVVLAKHVQAQQSQPGSSGSGS